MSVVDASQKHFLTYCPNAEPQWLWTWPKPLSDLMPECKTTMALNHVSSKGRETSPGEPGLFKGAWNLLGNPLCPAPTYCGGFNPLQQQPCKQSKQNHTPFQPLCIVPKRFQGCVPLSILFLSNKIKKISIKFNLSLAQNHAHNHWRKFIPAQL